MLSTFENTDSSHLFNENNKWAKNSALFKTKYFQEHWCPSSSSHQIFTVLSLDLKKLLYSLYLHCSSSYQCCGCMIFSVVLVLWRNKEALTTCTSFWFRRCEDCYNLRLNFSFGKFALCFFVSCKISKNINIHAIFSDINKSIFGIGELQKENLRKYWGLVCFASFKFLLFLFAILLCICFVLFLRQCTRMNIWIWSLVNCLKLFFILCKWLDLNSFVQNPPSFSTESEERK